MSDQRNDDIDQLYVDESYPLPPPLDEHIACVSIRSESNYKSDGYDVTLSAAFGSERIILKSEGFTVDVLLSISKAEIELKFMNSDVSLLETEENGHSDAWETSETVTSKTEKIKSRGWKVRGKSWADTLGAVNLGAYGSASTSGNRENSEGVCIERKRVQRDWHGLGRDRIKIGMTGEPLQGQVIPRCKRWRVFPRSLERPSGTFARINVRETWIKFEDPKYNYESASKHFREKLKAFLDGGSDVHQKLFLLLLRKLAFQGLQSRKTTSQATLTMDALVLRPRHEQVYSLQKEPHNRAITLPLDPIEVFLDAAAEDRESILIAYGVASDEIARPHVDSAKSRKGESFLPQSTPRRALEAYKHVCEHPGQDTDHLQKKFGRAIRDIVALGLAVRLKGKLVRSNNIPGDPTIIFKRALSQTDIVEVSRVVFRANPAATSAQIADAVSLKLGRDWSKKSTKLRHGNTIRSWVAWLEPHLIDPTASGLASALVIKATDPRRHGRRSLTPENAEEAQRMRDEGKTLSEVARHFSVSPVTMQRYTKGPRTKGVTPRRDRRWSMSEAQIDDAQRMRDEGRTLKEIAEHFGVSPWTIMRHTIAPQQRTYGRAQ